MNVLNSSDNSVLEEFDEKCLNPFIGQNTYLFWKCEHKLLKSLAALLRVGNIHT